jgi:hypothetical protein
VGMSRHKENLDVFVNSDKYSSLETLKRVLASKSNKELNVAKFIERKHPDNFFHKIGQDIGISDKYQIQTIITEPDEIDLLFLDNIKIIEEERVRSISKASLLR